MKGLHTNILLFVAFTLISSGQFYNIFGQSSTKYQTSFSQAKSNEPRAEWDFYLSNVDNKLSSLVVDFGLYKVAPLENKSNFVWISVKMNQAREDGLASTRENDILADMEKNMVDKFYSNYNSRFVGKLTSNGQRDMFFYVEDTTEYGNLLSEVMIAYPDYSFTYGSKSDENWSGYFDFLYPSPEQFQSIQNRRIINQLEKNGDKLIKPRKVDHWIYFKTKKDRSLFLNKIHYDGFNVITQNHDKKSGGLPYKLHISRIDKVDWTSVDEYVLYLWKLATACHGSYDGWETSVMVD